jgi:hypothetical protein
MAEEMVSTSSTGGGRWTRVPPLWDGHAGPRIADVLVASIEGLA